MKKYNKKLLLLTTVIIFGCVFAGIQFNENHAFEEDMYKNSGPLLKQIIKDGYYNIPADAVCPLEEQQLAWNMYDLYEKLLKEYKNKFNFTIFATGGKPFIITRFSGIEEVDQVFYDPKVITCNLDFNYLNVVHYFKKT